MSILVILSLSLYLPFSKTKLEPGPVVSLSLMDRNNILLREILSDEGGRCRWIKFDEVSTDLLKATIVAEDRYFYLHPGVNPFAIARALAQNARYGRVISGASTISQQVVRNIYRRRRTIFSKIYEIWQAIRLERTLSKDKILAQYLNRIYYGNLAYGIDAAARLYFDKSPSDLSLAEAAFLAGLPRSPSALDPYRFFRQAKKRQEHILDQMFDLGYIDAQRLERGKAEPLQLIAPQKNFRAPHFCDFILQQLPINKRRKLSRIQTTCDYRIQEKIEILVKDHIDSLAKKNITNAAIIVLENSTGEILCMVGSKDFFDGLHDGQVNGTTSLRQPGSTLKPFTYGLALERGMTAAEILEDRDFYFPTPEGSYSPRNYDLKFHGTVRLRQALACSYNVPAVSLLETLGPDLLFQKLRQAGFESLDRSPAYYGVGLTLGNGEVSLLELSRAYSALARGGLYFGDKTMLKCFDNEEQEIPWSKEEKPVRIFPPEIAFIITDILADRDARIPAFGYLTPLNLPFDCAIKTGTSADFRDNWTVGYTPRYTVGVWVGNFDAASMHNISGITGCGPLFKDIMLLLENGNTGVGFAENRNVTKAKICPLSGKLATKYCPGAMEDSFIKGTEPQEYCPVHTSESPSQGLQIFRKEKFRIAFPQDRDVFKIDPVLRPEFQRIKLKSTAAREMDLDRVEWWINGRKIGESSYPFSMYWNLKPGHFTIKAVALKAEHEVQSASIEIKVEE